MDTRKKALLGLAIAATLWSTGGMFIKMIDLNPIAIAGIRSGIAAIVMLIYLKKPKIHLNKINLFGALIYAALLLTFVGANKLTTAANAIFLQYTSPIWVIIFASLILKERIKKTDFVTIGAVFCGMILFFTGSFHGGSLLGNGIALCSGMLQAALIIMTKLQKEGSPIEISLLGNLLTFAISIPFLPHAMPDGSTIGALLLLGVFQCGIPYIFYMNSVRKVSSLEAILIPVLEPLFNPVWVFLFAGEGISANTLLGGAIIISSILANELLPGLKARKLGVPLSSKALDK